MEGRSPSATTKMKLRAESLGNTYRRKPLGATYVKNGYTMVKVEQPNKWRRRNRVTAEKQLRRPLRPDEVVHHRNEDTLNDAPDNLQIMTQSEHKKLHASLRKHK